ncbi:MAG: serine/threonine-protein kinase [Desulfobulbia bacterium]
MASMNDILKLDAGAIYRLERQIGRSTFGEIWAAIRCETDNPVAIKLVRRDQMENAPESLRPLWVDGLQKEIAFLERLRSGHLVAFRRKGNLDGLPVMVMERMDCNLHDQVNMLTRQGVRTDLKTAIEWLRHITEALRIIHREGLHHLDLKPHNLLLTEDSPSGRRLKIADFGTSLSLGTGTHAFAGTAGWQAPEQFFPSGKEPHGFVYTTNAQADYYALGLLFFFMITGRQTSFSQECAKLHRRDPEHAAWAERNHARPDLQSTDRRIFLESLGNPEPEFDNNSDDTWIPGLPVSAPLRQTSREALSLLEKLLASRPESRPQDIPELLTRINKVSSAVRLSALTINQYRISSGQGV